MSLISERNKGNSIEERFIEQTLRDQAASILRDSRREMRGFSQTKWRRVNMSVDKNSLTYEHLAVHRYQEMRSRKPKTYKSKSGEIKSYPGVKKKKVYPIHNKIIFSHKRFLIKQLSFGFTDEVKAQFRKLQDDVN